MSQGNDSEFYQKNLQDFGKLYFPDDIDKSINDLAGLDIIKDFLNSFYSTIINIQKKKQLPVKLRLSALLTGIPGTGKTTIVKAMAKQHKIPILVIFSSKLIQSFLGESLKRIAKLMEICQNFVKNTNTPLILFFDEIDAIASERANQNEVGEIKRTVISFLQELDYLLDLQLPIGVIGATNHPESLDTAVWRRFTFKFELPRPDKKVRTDIFNIFKGKFEIAGYNIHFLYDEVDKEDFTGSDIERAFEIVLMRLIAKHDSKDIYDTDFSEAMGFVKGTTLQRPGVEGEKEETKEKNGTNNDMGDHSKDQQNTNFKIRK